MASDTFTSTRTGERAPRDPTETDQRMARAFGVLFVITFLTSIPAAMLFQSAVQDPVAFMAGGGSVSRIYLAALLELLLIFANIGTAVVLYPIARRQNRVLALGYVTARIIECVFLAAGLIFALGMVSLRQDAPGATDLAISLAALKEWTFLFGPGLVVPFGNGLILGYLMYRSGLIPRQVAWLGLIGGLVLLVWNVGEVFGAWGTSSALPALFVAPEFIWEAFLGIYCGIRGFRRDSPILQTAPLEARR